MYRRVLADCSAGSLTLLWYRRLRRSRRRPSGWRSWRSSRNFSWWSQSGIPPRKPKTRACSRSFICVSIESVHASLNANGRSCSHEQLCPDYMGIELGIGESLIIKAIAESTGRATTKIKEDLRKEGDLGKVAMASIRPFGH